jgi:hypothetical protein
LSPPARGQHSSTCVGGGVNVDLRDTGSE